MEQAEMIQQQQPEWMIDGRGLATATDDDVAVKIDYNILSVAALTLALILLVEGAYRMITCRSDSRMW